LQNRSDVGGREMVKLSPGAPFVCDGLTELEQRCLASTGGGVDRWQPTWLGFCRRTKSRTASSRRASRSSLVGMPRRMLRPCGHRQHDPHRYRVKPGAAEAAHSGTPCLSAQARSPPSRWTRRWRCQRRHRPRAPSPAACSCSRSRAAWRSTASRWDCSPPQALRVHPCSDASVNDKTPRYRKEPGGGGGGCWRPLGFPSSGPWSRVWCTAWRVALVTEWVER